MDRRPRLAAVGHVVFASLTGSVIGLVVSFLVTKLQTGLSEPYPYIINIVGLLALQTVAVWLWFFAQPWLDKIIKSGSIAVLRRRTLITIPEESLRFPVKYNQGTMLKAVVVLETTLATYLTSHLIEPSDLFGLSTYIWVPTLLGSVAMAMLAMSQTTVIHAIVHGRHKYQMEQQ